MFVVWWNTEGSQESLHCFAIKSTKYPQDDPGGWSSCSAHLSAHRVIGHDFGPCADGKRSAKLRRNMWKFCHFHPLAIYPSQVPASKQMKDIEGFRFFCRNEIRSFKFTTCKIDQDSTRYLHHRHQEDPRSTLGAANPNQQIND